MNCSTPGFPDLHCVLEFSQAYVHWVGYVIQPSHSLLSPSLLALNLSQHQVFFNELALRIRWPKYWSFSFSISPSNEHPGLISFRMDWLDLLAVQGTLSVFSSINSCSAFFMVHLSHLYMTIGKTKVNILVAQSCPTLCYPMGCSLPGSTVHADLQARILKWVVISFSRGSFQLMDQTWVFCIAGKFFTVWATRKNDSFD